MLKEPDNVFLVLSGHGHGVDIEVRRDVGTPGYHIMELLADYQFYEVFAAVMVTGEDPFADDLANEVADSFECSS